MIQKRKKKERNPRSWGQMLVYPIPQKSIKENDWDLGSHPTPIFC